MPSQLTAWLLADLQPQTATYSLFTQRQIVNIGLLSYSLYLWHWGVLCISRWTIGIHWWSWPFQVALMILLAIDSYRYIETPLRKAEWTIKRWRTIGHGAGAVTGTAGILFILGETPGLSLYTGRPPTLMQGGGLRR